MILNCTEAAASFGLSIEKNPAAASTRWPSERVAGARWWAAGAAGERSTGGAEPAVCGATVTQIRYSSPLWRSDEPVASPWDGVAKRLNSYLGANWPTVPWSGDQVATLALLLSMAEEEGADATGL